MLAIVLPSVAYGRNPKPMVCVGSLTTYQSGVQEKFIGAPNVADNVPCGTVTVPAKVTGETNAKTVARIATRIILLAGFIFFPLVCVSRKLLIYSRAVRWLENHRMRRNKESVPFFILEICLKQRVGILKNNLVADRRIGLVHQHHEAKTVFRC